MTAPVPAGPRAVAVLEAARCRLAEEIHRRAYHDAGVEVSPGPPGDGVPGPYRIGTPHCKHGDRTLGELRLGPAADPDPAAGSARWAAAFARLGVADWRSREHLGCFHRRGKARHDLVFAVAARLVEGAPAGAARMWALHPATEPDGLYLALVAGAGGEVPAGRAARHLAVRCCGRPLAVLRSDGWAATGGGALALDDLWWAGLDRVELAHAVRQAARHEH